MDYNLSHKCQALDNNTFNSTEAELHALWLLK